MTEMAQQQQQQQQGRLEAAAVVVGVALLVLLGLLAVVGRFLVRSNVLVKREKKARQDRAAQDEGGWHRLERRASELRGHAGGSMQDLQRLQAEALSGRQSKFRRALNKLSIRAAIDSLRERRRYRWVTAEAKHGDGLRSIFAESSAARPPRSPRFSGQTQDAGDEVLRSLRATEIFSWFPDDILRALAGRATRMRLEAGTELYHADETAQDACYYVVLSGRMSVRLLGGSAPAEDDSKVLFGPSSSVTGLSDLLAAITAQPVITVATVAAEEDAEVVAIPRTKCLEPLFAEYPGLREELLLRILIRLNRVTLMTVFRLTGRVFIPDVLGAHESRQPGALGASSPSMMKDRALLFVANELGLTRSELWSVATVVHWRRRPRRAAAEDNSSGSLDWEVGAGANVENTDEDEGSDAMIASSDEEGANDSRRKDEVEAVISIVRMSKGQDVLEVSTRPAMYVVLCGRLEMRVGQRSGGRSRVEHVYEEGQSFGHLSIMTGAWSDWYAGRGTATRKADANSVWVHSSHDHDETVLARLSLADYNAVVDKFPKAIAHKASQLCQTLSPLLRMFDLSTQWKHVCAGDEIMRRGEACNFLYVVLHGRLRGSSGSSKRGELRDVREFGRGALVGEIAFLTEDPADQTVTALRSSQLGVIPRAAMLEVMRAYPEVVFNIGRTMSRVVSRAAARMRRPLDVRGRFGLNTSVVAVVPASPSAPVDLFLYTLVGALRSMGSTTETLNSDMVERMAEERKLGVGNVVSAPRTALEQMILLTWLSEAEDTNDIVFYQADPWSDPEPSWWSSLCIEQADLVLYVANAADGPKVTALERSLADVNTNARKELVLVHLVTEDTDPSELPRNTRDWIVNRGDISHHHHIRFHPDKTGSVGSAGSFDVDHYKSDFRRLARWLLGESVGVVLGGGGARGLAHIAVLRCMEEMGIPVDFIAGSSIGAYLGGMYAMKTDTLLLHRILSKFVHDMSSNWKRLLDLTLPVTAYFSGVAFNRGIVRTFGNTKIEDLWLPYFCMTTDLTDSVEIAHRNGSLWRYVRASMTLVNFIPPLCDVVEEDDDEDDDDEDDDEGESEGEAAASAPEGEASKGPLDSATSEDKGAEPAEDGPAEDDSCTDDEDEADKQITGSSGATAAAAATTKKKKKQVVHYLADGGYTNNLPADVMRQYLGPKATIIAVDVQGSWKFAGDDYGDHLSGWKYLLQWLNPWQRTPNIPTAGDIQTQLAYISSVKQGSTASQSSSKHGSAYSRAYGGIAPTSNADLRELIDLYLTPPVDEITTLEFHRNSEIQSRSYAYARKQLTKWIQSVRERDSAKLRFLSWRSAQAAEESRAAVASKRDRSRKNRRVSTMLHRRSQSWAKMTPTSAESSLEL